MVVDRKYSETEIQNALAEIAEMDHYNMCYNWRNAGNDIYFDNRLPTAKAFKDRLFEHFGGFTKEISKEIGW